MYPSEYNFFGAPVIDAILPTWSYVEKCTCAHSFSTWHVCSSIFHLARNCLTTFLTLDMIYNKGGANHAHMQRRIEADSVFRCRYSFVEKANLVAIVRTRMTEDRVSFLKLWILLGFLSTLYKWQADLPLTPSTLQQDHQGPPTKFDSWYWAPTPLFHLWVEGQGNACQSFFSCSEGYSA